MSITGQKVPFVCTGLVALTLKFRNFQRMKQYYALQAQLPHFAGPARQRGNGYGSLPAGVGPVLLPFDKFLFPVFKSICIEFYLKAYRSCFTWHRKKTSRQAVPSAVRKTVMKQSSVSKIRRGKRLVRREKFFSTRFKNVD